MATFAEKARWIRVSTAEALASLLDNVKVQARPPFQYTADPPCHASASGESFHFGDAPGGGIAVSCWSCCRGSGSWASMVDRIEEHIGYAIQARRPDGHLRYRFGAREQHAPPGSRPMARNPVQLFGTECQGLTLGKVLEAPVFFAGRAGRKAAYQVKIGEEWYACRQSLRDADGGLEIARFGGHGWWTKPDTKERVRIQVWHWRSLSELQVQMNLLMEASGDRLQPCMALGGSEEHPYPLDICVIDFDYKPDLDSSREGAAFRDTFRERMIAAGAPVFLSSSGNGFHALFRQSEKWTRANRAARQGMDRYPADRQKTHSGAVVEIFMAGVRRHVVLRLERAIANDGSDQLLPVLSRQDVDSMIEDAALGRPSDLKSGALVQGSSNGGENGTTL